MARRFWQGDLFAGGAAAASLLLLVFPLGLTPWLAIPLAGAVYLGLALLPPRRPRRPVEPDDDVRQQHLAFRAAVANLVAIRTLALRIARPEVLLQVDRIADRTGQILAVMREDRNLTAAPLFNEQLVEPIRSMLTQYVRLSTREVRSAEAELERIETNDLPMIERAVDNFFEKLHRAQVVDLATLREVLEFNLERIDATSLRRFTP